MKKFKQIMVNVEVKQQMDDIISKFGLNVSYNELIKWLIKNNDKKSNIDNSGFKN